MHAETMSCVCLLLQANLFPMNSVINRHLWLPSILNSAETEAWSPSETSEAFLFPKAMAGAPSQRPSLLAIVKGANFQQRDHLNNVLAVRTDLLLPVKGWAVAVASPHGKPRPTHQTCTDEQEAMSEGQGTQTRDISKHKGHADQWCGFYTTTQR